MHSCDNQADAVSFYVNTQLVAWTPGSNERSAAQQRGRCNVGLRCSGDDAMNVSGDARPTISDCLLQGKKCGARVFGASRPRFGQCRLQDCGEQGLKAMDTAKPSLTLYVLGSSTLNAQLLNPQSSAPQYSSFSFSILNLQLLNSQMLSLRGFPLELQKRIWPCKCSILKHAFHMQHMVLQPLSHLWIGVQPHWGHAVGI